MQEYMNREMQDERVNKLMEFINERKFKSGKYRFS